MDDLEFSSSRFAWSGVIEVLAAHRNVNLQYLQDLIQCIPELSDNLNKEAIELIALRNLESLFDHAMLLNSGVPSSSDQEEIHFDSSESPSHVLKRVMELPSMSSLRKDGDNPIPNVRKCSSDKLVREVYSYITRKLASMPGSSLLELSDTLKKGDACHETDLEWERSGLKTQELVQNSTSEAQSGNSPPKTQLIYDIPAYAEKTTSSLISSDMQDCPIDDQSDKFLPTKKRRRNMPDCPVDEQNDNFLSGKNCRDSGNGSVPCTELILTSSIASDMQDCPIDDQSDKFLPTKKRRRNMPDCPLDEQNDNFLSGKNCRDNGNGSVPCTELKLTSSISSDKQDCPVDVECALSPPAKKLRHDSNGSSFSEKNSAERNSPVDSQNGNSPPEKQSHDSSGSVASTEKNSDPSISSDINQPFPLSPKPAQPTEKNCPVDSQNWNSPPEKQSHDSSGSVASTEKNSVFSISSDVNQPFPLSPKPAQPPLTCWPSDVLNEIKQRNAENSLTPPDVTELDICIKCCKDGEVLFCRGSNCSIVVHERCLGITESIDNKDNFLCPFCVCSLAKSKYTEARERMLVAREKLSLFVGGNPDNPSRQGSRVDKASTDKQRDAHLARVDVHSSTPKCLSKQAEGITGNCCPANSQFTNLNTSSSRKGRDERKFKDADKQHEGRIEQDTGYTSPPKSIQSNSCQTEKRFVLVNAFPSTDEQAFTDEDGKDVHQARQASTYEQHNSHLAQDNVHDSPPNCILEEGEDKAEKTCQLEKGDQMMPIEKFQYAGGSSGVSTQQRLDLLSKKASRSNTAKISDNLLTPQSQRAEEENPAATTTSRCLPQSFEKKSDRPNRVPWTEKEVEMLKEGVKRFGSGSDGVMPWTAILKFGTGVFSEGRTGVNLKDKWRNLLKANPELRQL